MPTPANEANWTPRQTVEELDRYIVGQADAKRAIAIAVRNRWRRSQLPEDVQADIAPKNILMAGPTGVGKTEIARRLAKLMRSPFVKVEATKYTEVGYYGRDVESMVRDLVESAITLVRNEAKQRVQADALRRTEDRLIDLLVPRTSSLPLTSLDNQLGDVGESQEEEDEARHQRTREKFRTMLQGGKLETKEVELSVASKAAPMMVGGVGIENLDVDFQGMFEKIMPKSSKRRAVTVATARKILLEEETDNLLDDDKISADAIESCETSGIIFVDEIDKVIASDGKNADVSRQGVQRDLLPIVEGTTVQTKHGYVKTDHILFIAAGAFHHGKPAELMPELQGRFPIRVELHELTEDDFVRILTEPRNSLVTQYQALLSAEGVSLTFTDDAIRRLAEFGYRTNQTTQNIGARRLYTILEKLLDQLSFDAPEMRGAPVEVDAAYVDERLKSICEDEDLSRFIL